MKGKYPNGLAYAMERRPSVTQADLAKAADTSHQQINRLVHGEREMTALWAEKLAPALRTSPETLVFPGIRRFRAPVLSWVSEGEATFKRYRTGNPPKLQPYSTSPDHETLTMTEGTVVVGKVGRVINDLFKR